MEIVKNATELVIEETTSDNFKVARNEFSLKGCPNCRVLDADEISRRKEYRKGD